MARRRREVNLDEVLDQLGHFGRYQFRLYALIILPILFTATYNAQYIFAAGAIAHRCVVPECESPPYKWKPGEWGAWAKPESCERRAPAAGAGACSADAFLPERQPCSAWVYANNNTIVAEFDLACQELKRTMVGTVHSLGVFFALLAVGVVSDTVGRRTTFIMTASSRAAVGLARSFSPNYWVYIVLEFLDALVGAGVYSTGFVLALEMVGKEMRVIGGACISCTFAIGQMLLAVVAWAFPYWRTLTRVLYTPSLFFLIYFCFLEESIRWLLSKGKKEKATHVLHKIANFNRREVSMNTIVKLSSEADFQKREMERGDRESLFAQVTHSRALVGRLAICSFCWITVTFVYYGLSINSVSLAGNMYINYILISLVEIPGYALSVVTLDRFGRKRSITTAFLICGISLIGLPFIPNTRGTGYLLLSLAGKMSASFASTSLYVYGAELFPTELRVTTLATLSMFGRLGQAAAMLTPLLMALVPWLPYLLFGLMALAAALLLLLAPETMRGGLPNTVAQAENINRSGAATSSIDLGGPGGLGGRPTTSAGTSTSPPPWAAKDANTSTSAPGPSIK